MMVPLAHSGHWLAQVLYIVPVVAVVGWIAVKSLIDRRKRP